MRELGREKILSQRRFSHGHNMNLLNYYTVMWPLQTALFSLLCKKVNCSKSILLQPIGETLGVPIHVFGPETHMTAIVGMALGKRAIPPTPHREGTTANFLLPGDQVL